MNTNKNLLNDTAITAQHPDYKTEIAGILRGSLTPGLMRERLRSYHEKDIAAALELLKKEERSKLYRILDADTLADVLEYSEGPEAYFAELSVRRQVEILSRQEPSAAAAYLQRMEKPQRATLLELMDDETRREITLLSSFDEDEIGSRMTTNYISIHAGISVRQAMRELVEQAAENDNVSTIYVVDGDGTLAGAIDLKDLIIARETTQLEAITMTSYPYVYASEQIEDCIERMKEYSEDSIPVLDEENRRVLLDGAPLELTETEFSILQCLAQNRGRVVPVRTIYETVWHEAYMPASNNTVMVHIVNLEMLQLSSGKLELHLQGYFYLDFLVRGDGRSDRLHMPVDSFLQKVRLEGGILLHLHEPVLAKSF